MHVKFEVRSFNRFKLVWLTGPLHAHTQTDTHIKLKQYFCQYRHSLHSLGGDNKTLKHFLTSTTKSFMQSMVSECFLFISALSNFLTCIARVIRPLNRHWLTTLQSEFYTNFRTEKQRSHKHEKQAEWISAYTPVEDLDTEPAFQYSPCTRTVTECNCQLLSQEEILQHDRNMQPISNVYRCSVPKWQVIWVGWIIL